MNKLINTGVWVVFLYTMGVSISHVIATGGAIGLPSFEAATAWVVVDIVFLLGKAGRSPHRSEGIRKGGLVLMLFGGTLSLFCNVYAGPTLGAKIWGVVVVIAMIVTESYGSKLVGESANRPAIVTVDEMNANIQAAIAAAQAQADAATQAQLATAQKQAAAQLAAMRQNMQDHLNTQIAAIEAQAAAAVAEAEQIARQAAARRRTAPATSRRKTETVTGRVVNPATGEVYSERHSRRLTNGK